MFTKKLITKHTFPRLIVRLKSHCTGLNFAQQPMSDNGERKKPSYYFTRSCYTLETIILVHEESINDYESGNTMVLKF